MYDICPSSTPETSRLVCTSGNKVVGSRGGSLDEGYVAKMEALLLEDLGESVDELLETHLDHDCYVFGWVVMCGVCRVKIDRWMNKAEKLYSEDKKSVTSLKTRGTTNNLNRIHSGIIHPQIIYFVIMNQSTYLTCCLCTFRFTFVALSALMRSPTYPATSKHHMRTVEGSCRQVSTCYLPCVDRADWVSGG